MAAYGFEGLDRVWEKDFHTLSFHLDLLPWKNDSEAVPVVMPIAFIWSSSLRIGFIFLYTLWPTFHFLTASQWKVRARFSKQKGHCCFLCTLTLHNLAGHSTSLSVFWKPKDIIFSANSLQMLSVVCRAAMCQHCKLHLLPLVLDLPWTMWHIFLFPILSLPNSTQTQTQELLNPHYLSSLHLSEKLRLRVGLLLSLLASSVKARRHKKGRLLQEASGYPPWQENDIENVHSKLDRTNPQKKRQTK